eukprot:COSAG06_NODE_2667_length_6473_cov_2.348917_6_plen_357_part_01
MSTPPRGEPPKIGTVVGRRGLRGLATPRGPRGFEETIVRRQIESGERTARGDAVFFNDRRLAGMRQPDLGASLSRAGTSGDTSTVLDEELEALDQEFDAFIESDASSLAEFNSVRQASALSVTPGGDSLLQRSAVDAGPFAEVPFDADVSAIPTVATPSRPNLTPRTAIRDYIALGQRAQGQALVSPERRTPASARSLNHGAAEDAEGDNAAGARAGAGYQAGDEVALQDVVGAVQEIAGIQDLAEPQPEPEPFAAYDSYSEGESESESDEDDPIPEDAGQLVPSGSRGGPGGRRPGGPPAPRSPGGPGGRPGQPGAAPAGAAPAGAAPAGAAPGTASPLSAGAEARLRLASILRGS